MIIEQLQDVFPELTRASLQNTGAQTSRIHKPTTLVSFGLPVPLSLHGRAHDWWLADRGQTSARKASGSGRQVRLTRHFLGEGNASEEDANESKRKTRKFSPTSTHVSPMILMATRNLINMVAAGATSGAVLLTLLAAKHF
jgi:hypothetical protein